MTKHEIVHQLVKIQKVLFKIKEISCSGDIDRLCVEGISLTVTTGDKIAPDIVRKIKKSQETDPMM